MKSMKSIIFAATTGAAMFLFTSNANAFMNVVPISIPDKAIVQVTIPENHHASIAISDDTGEILHFESVDAGMTTNKVYDISNLGDGVYTFFSEVEHSKTTKKVRIKDAVVEVISKEVEYKPVFRIRDNRLMVNYLNEDMREVELLIEGEGRSFASVRGDDMLFHKTVDVSNLLRGEYDAKVKVGMNTFTYRFEIN